MFKIGLLMFFGLTNAAHADTGVTYTWAEWIDGFGHCFEFTADGQPLNEGRPVQDFHCGEVTYSWEDGPDAFTHCYEFGGGFLINEGQPVNDYYCGG